MKTYLFAAIVLALVVFSFIRAWYYTRETGGVDLRCRTIGVRLSQAGYSPYFYKWKKDDGELLLDPNDVPSRKVNGNVVTPAVLAMLSPFGHIAYQSTRYIWTILQYAFFIGTLLLLVRYNIANYKHDLLAAAIIGGCFLYSSLWFYNIERGQLYSFYTFGLALIYGLYILPWKYNRLAAGFITGLLFFIRPLTAVFFLAALLKRDIKCLSGGFAGLVIGFLLFVLPRQAEWKEYSAAMKEYSNEMLVKEQPVYEPVANMPQEIEGMRNLRAAVHFDNLGISTVQYYMAAKGVRLGSLVLGVCYLVVAGILSLLFLRIKRGSNDSGDILLFAFLLYILAEFFIVGFRGGYNLVEWLVGISLLYRRAGFFILVPALLLVPLFLFFSFPHQYEVAELLLIGLLGYVVFLSDHFSQPRKISGGPN